LPVTLYGELFYNFSVLGIPILYLLMSYFNKLYFKLLDKLNEGNISPKFLFLFFLYLTLMQFIRGSGIDLWLIYGGISLIVFIPLSKIIKFNS